MIIGLQKNVRWYQLALIPVVLPVGVAALALVAVPVFAGFVRDRLRNGFWG